MVPGHFDFTYVALDDGLVEANGLDEEEFETFLDDDRFVQRSPALLRRVGRVEDGHLAILVLKILQNIIQTFLTDLPKINEFERPIRFPDSRTYGQHYFLQQTAHTKFLLVSDYYFSVNSRTFQIAQPQRFRTKNIRPV